nr:hypothetical protein [Nesterenkonia massiliensis]
MGVVDQVKDIDLGLKLSNGLGHRLGIQVAEQRLVEPFVLALGGRPTRPASDRFDPEAGEVGDQLPFTSPAGSCLRGNKW